MLVRDVVCGYKIQWHGTCIYIYTKWREKAGQERYWLRVGWQIDQSLICLDGVVPNFHATPLSPPTAILRPKILQMTTLWKYLWTLSFLSLIQTKSSSSILSIWCAALDTCRARWAATWTLHKIYPNLSASLTNHWDGN